MEYVSKTQHYLKVKKPLLERQRRARINKCLDAMKHIIADLNNNEEILRMDKAEMLEATIVHLRQMRPINHQEEQVDGFRNGYINAANEVSRVLASTQGMSADLGKAVMKHLGASFNRLQELRHQQLTAENNYRQQLTISVATAPLSPASSGYHSDMDIPASPATTPKKACDEIWRPW